jgi:hypothetical protein
MKMKIRFGRVHEKHGVILSFMNARQIIQNIIQSYIGFTT